MFSFKQLQAEQIPWVKHNFPDRPAWMPLMGMFEEYGEFLDASRSGSEEEISDAIADITIFLADFCTSQDLDLEKLWELRKSKYNNDFLGEGDLGIILGKLAHHYLKSYQNIRGGKDEHRLKIESNICKLLEFLDYMVWNEYNSDDNFINLIEKTWNKVKKRDFRKNSIDGISK